MTYVDTDDIATAVYHIIDGVVVPITGVLPTEAYTDMADRIKSILGRFTGLRAEDGKPRTYDISLIDGEPYVMDA